MEDTTNALATQQQAAPSGDGTSRQATPSVAAPHATQPAASALVPQTYEQVERFSNLVAGSQLVPTQYRGQPADVMVAVMTGREIGLKPLQALQNIAVINGKPSIYGDAAIALVRASGACAEINEVLRGEGDQMEARCYARRSDTGDEMHHTFSVADAKAARLWKKKGPWSAYPQRMLQMRARSWVLRDLFADVLQGLYIAEEARDIPSEDEKRNAKFEKLLADMRGRLEEAKPEQFGAVVRQCEDYITQWPPEQQGKAEALISSVRDAREAAMDEETYAQEVIGEPADAAEVAEPQPEPAAERSFERDLEKLEGKLKKAVRYDTPGARQRAVSSAMEGFAEVYPNPSEERRAQIMAVYEPVRQQLAGTQDEECEAYDPEAPPALSKEDVAGDVAPQTPLPEDFSQRDRLEEAGITTAEGVLSAGSIDGLPALTDIDGIGEAREEGLREAAEALLE